MSKFMLRIKQATVLLLLRFFRFLAPLFPKDIWVICERGDDARDNAYWMYKYIKENVPMQKVYYLIDSSSVDYKKVCEDAVQIGSLKYFWALAVADKIISTHYAAGIRFFTHKFFCYSGLGDKFYFLQHGITHNDLHQLHGDVAHMRLFICGAQPEYDWIVNHFDHPQGVVQYTGFARFDQLHNCKAKHQILVMPTWRAYIKNKEQFLESEYYHRWFGLLNNPKLRENLELWNLDLIFYPHYEVQRYIDGFKSDSERIIIADFESYDVQTLLKDSAVLISDYSSVIFDFAYMRKPVIYYQFDEKSFFEGHYNRGFFNYKEMGFGDVCSVESEVVEAISRICVQGMQMEDCYIEKAKLFFPLYDASNCERIFRVISEDMK